MDWLDSPALSAAVRTGFAPGDRAALVAAAVLSDRYISDRFLPDKAIDLVDESASRLRMEIDSSPLELDEADRRVRQLEIELAAMAKEKKEVKEPIERELAHKAIDPVSYTHLTLPTIYSV